MRPFKRLVLKGCSGRHCKALFLFLQTKPRSLISFQTIFRWLLLKDFRRQYMRSAPSLTLNVLRVYSWKHVLTDYSFLVARQELLKDTQKHDYTLLNYGWRWGY